MKPQDSVRWADSRTGRPRYGTVVQVIPDQDTVRVRPLHSGNVLVMDTSEVEVVEL